MFMYWEMYPGPQTVAIRNSIVRVLAEMYLGILVFWTSRQELGLNKCQQIDNSMVVQTARVY